jgi:glycosyltransferase involved in cell wall biosynthesis
LPTFSIIIPCYNQAHFLNDALQSLLLQSFTDWEAIIVNDGSLDDTSLVANEWTKRDNRVKLVEQQNAGLSAARNAGIAAASGLYIALLDADDKYGSYFLQTVYAHLEQGIGLVCCGYTYFNTKGTIYRIVRQSEQLEFKYILTGNLFPPVAVAFQRQVLDKTGLFDTDLKSAEDWDLWIRMYKIGVKISVIEDALVYYRISDNSMSRQAFTMYDALKKVAQRACQKDERLSFSVTAGEEAAGELSATVKRMLLMCMGVAVMQGKIEQAIELMHQEFGEWGFDLHPEDFKYMCSYLSFRYQVSNEDLKWIKDELMPLFRLFLEKLAWQNLDNKKAFTAVFSIHHKLIIRKKWGFVSPLINRFNW